MTASLADMLEIGAILGRRAVAIRVAANPRSETDAQRHAMAVEFDTIEEIQAVLGRVQARDGLEAAEALYADTLAALRVVNDPRDAT